MKLLNFISSLFCGDKDKGCILLRLVSIYDFRASVASTGNKVRFQVVADMKLLMKHVDRVKFLACAWEHE